MSELSGQGKRLIVVGCMASVQPGDIIKRAPQALIMAPRDYAGFDSMVEENFGQGGSGPIIFQPSSITSVLPIAQGCIGACSYCITKQARGTLTSYSTHDILMTAEENLSKGAKELLVTAQDTACYGFDLNTDLSDLIRKLTALDGDFKIRIGMMNPDNLSRIIDNFLPALVAPKVYQFIHLPVQSGSDSILEVMNRGYTAQQFIELTNRLRASSLGITLATDVITGFPGETEDDHQKTVELMNKIRPDIVNVTRFSPRQGTPAAKAKNQVVGWVSKERSRELTKLRFAIAQEIHEAMVGSEEEIMITEVGKPGTMIGRTSAYRPVVIKGKLNLGSKHLVEIAGAESTYLVGKVR
jgi:MiaB-like tRNA modifying enzyme